MVSETAIKRYDTILVIGKDCAQAKFLWRFVRNKYPKDAWVKFVGRDASFLDGLCPWTMAIIFVGEYWRNPISDSPHIQHFKRLGADVIYEEVDKSRKAVVSDGEEENRDRFLQEQTLEAQASGDTPKG